MKNQSFAREVYIGSRARFLLTNAAFVMIINTLIFFSMSVNVDTAMLNLRVKDIVEIQSVAHDLQAKVFNTGAIKASSVAEQTQAFNTVFRMPAYVDLQNRIKAQAVDNPWGESFFKGEQWLLKGNDPAASEDAKNWIHFTITKTSAELLDTSLGLKKKMEATLFCYILIALLLGIWVSMIYHRVKLKRSMQPAPYKAPYALRDTLGTVGS